MLTKTGPKLLDFGLATRDPSAVVARADVTTMAPLSAQVANTFAGTLPYMAPELLDGKAADVRSDVFAFGAMLYEMISGRPAFAGTQAGLVAAILTGDPSRVDGLPPSVDRLIRRCLAKDPEERWQTARDLREALSLIQIDGGRDSTRPVAAPHWRRLALATLVIAVLSLAVIPRFRSLFTGASSSAGTPVIVLMDSPVPERVYDAATRKDRGTNADDLTDILRDLPVQLHKETTSALWHREDEVLKQHPSLVMMHLSSFAEPTTDPTSPLQPNAQERTRAFLGYVALAEPGTKFVVYSRGFAAQAERDVWVSETERRFPALRGRVQLMHIPGDGNATFRDPQTGRAVRERVKLLLDLH
ncbi:MAG: protein kinase [Acidobacteria bacterium]|nr:protein kinase [Acidobacteriota bacterium]